MGLITGACYTYHHGRVISMKDSSQLAARPHPSTAFRFGVPWFQVEVTNVPQASFKAAIQAPAVKAPTIPAKR